MSEPHVAVIGAGTMGAGIAQVAATHGWTVHLFDVDEPTVTAAIDGVRARLDRLVEKERMTADDRDAAAARLRVGGRDALPACGLLIEAIVEDLDVKTRVLGDLVDALPDDAIVATNTSSLSVSAIGAAIGQPGRTVGMHFFNPAPLMKLVEIIAGRGTDPAVADRATAVAESWGKRVARAADVPGFIVNHVARPYYLEAFRIVEEGRATVDEIDDAMRTLGGFRMGPFELTDLIGQDVNAATTRSVWEQLGHPPLLAPSRLQEQLVADGHLGRKTKRGVYDYASDPKRVALDVPAPDPTPSAALDAVVSEFVAAATDAPAEGRAAYVFARILAALIVQATHASARGVASAHDIDTALKYGVNYPRGPFEWLMRVGEPTCDRLVRWLATDADHEGFAWPTAFADALRNPAP
jgi:3-hydroxybutyryl-CoA dehydrogenase